MLMASVTVELALFHRCLYSNNFLNFIYYHLILLLHDIHDINILNRIPLQIQNLQNGDKDQRRRKTLDLENPNLEMTSLVLGSRYGNQKTSTRS